MKAFIHLLQNERMKIVKRPGIWIYLVVSFFMTILFGVSVRQLFQGAGMQYWEFMKLTANLLIMIQLVAIVFSSDIVPNEYVRGTIKSLLIKPYKRWKILLSKYVTVLLLITGIMLIQLIFSLVVSIFFFYKGMFMFDAMFVQTILQYVTTYIEIIIICTFAFMLSILFKSSLIATTVTILLYFASSALLVFFEHYQYEGARYFLFSNTNLMPYFIGKPMFEGMTITFSILNNSIHMALFLFVSFFIFNKRDIYV
ncbi:ABC transporter permease [Bacillus salitolerans]|uniref:ABC transporter permease n=1 Tax=Bacillus salitolerans TaxID=1437434 RepID=A0ABW4LS53_9BACI